MTEIYYLHFKLPGHDLGVLEQYFSFEVSFYRISSIENNPTGGFTCYLANVVLGTNGDFQNPTLIRQEKIKIYRDVVYSGRELLEWLQQLGHHPDEIRTQDFYTRLDTFDKNLAGSFINALNKSQKKAVGYLDH